VRWLKSVIVDGGLYSVGGLIMALIATIFLAAILTSPGSWEWWSAVSVHGLETGGVVSYSYRGQTYSLDDEGSTADGRRTVYLNPANPSQGVLGIEVAQISDSVVTGGLYLASAAFLVAVAVRRRAKRVRQSADPDPNRFGEGIDAETVHRIIESRRSER
jgi:hypothetical protein